MSICEKHRKFAAYWEDIGKPPLEFVNNDFKNWSTLFDLPFEWLENCDFRISGDRHWELRKKWVDSGKTLPIEWRFGDQYGYDDNDWKIAAPEWLQDCEYREAVEKHEDICTEPAEEKPYFERLADSFIALGNALKDRNTNITELTELASNCGLELQFRIVSK